MTHQYELMVILDPEIDERTVAPSLDKFLNVIRNDGGTIDSVDIWGRRRLAYPIDRHREGSYHIILFEAPSEAILELEHTLLITEEVLRHLITRVDRPTKVTEGDDADYDVDTEDLQPGMDDEDEDDRPGAFIDESESEAAPAAID